MTIHPFEDSNGRIARAIADKSLARALDGAETALGAVLYKAKLWQRINRRPVNDR